MCSSYRYCHKGQREVSLTCFTQSHGQILDQNKDLKACASFSESSGNRCGQRNLIKMRGRHWRKLHFCRQIFILPPPKQGLLKPRVCQLPTTHPQPSPQDCFCSRCCPCSAVTSLKVQVAYDGGRVGDVLPSFSLLTSACLWAFVGSMHSETKWS